MPIRTVDVDTLFLLQFVVDWLWFWAAARLASVPIPRWRLTVAAGVGAGLGVLGQFPFGAFLYGWPVKLATTAGCILLAFGWAARTFPRLLLFTLLAGIAMAGGVLLLTPEPAPVGALVDLGGGLLAGYTGEPQGSALILAGCALALCGGGLLLRSAVAWHRLGTGLRSVRLTVAGVEVSLTALVDTGNCLHEPISGRPVLVAESDAVACLLPAAVAAVVGRPITPDTLARLPTPWARRCRLVPYHAVGNPAGLMLAFGPDGLRVGEVLLRTGAEAGEPPLYVGLAPGRLDPTGAYQALLPADVSIPGP